jgi:hypothetical protein
MLRDYLTGIIDGINRDDKMRRAAAAAITGDRTFGEITKFAAKNGIKFLE